MQPHPGQSPGQRKKLRIAYRIWKSGIYKTKIRSGRGKLLWNTKVEDEAGNLIMIPREEVDSFIDENFFTALQIYCLTENLGSLPFAGGWAEQPADIITVINSLKLEQSRIEREEWESEKKKK